ncbi:MAG TPA: class I SAM-dependent methyltransferase [Bellilinea sp.]|nr:class I SAM-dependent methyltransferase [Bellilinea sp.]
MTVIAQDTMQAIQTAVQARQGLIDARHAAALRLFNGYTEGCPGLVIDLYARTLVFFNQANQPAEFEALILLLQHWLLEYLPWLQAVIVKTRNAEDADSRRGVLTHGQQADGEISEHGVRYALNLTLNQDASLYLDTRNLREWLRRRLKSRQVLNTFAYTGSLGVAALAGGATRVVQLDLSANFLALARQSYALNGFTVHSQDFLAGDYFRQVARLKDSGALFDCVILDPPFFSVTPAGRVDLAAENARLINKVRPLVAHNGILVAVNNALFVSGSDYLDELRDLNNGGYLVLEEIIPVPLDVTGYPETIRESHYPTDPAPFNHPTKIAVLRVQRKDQAGIPVRSL